MLSNLLDVQLKTEIFHGSVFVAKEKENQHFHTLTCPVEAREFAEVTVIPFVTFGNGEESDPFTWGGGGGGGGGGDCVMN